MSLHSVLVKRLKRLLPHNSAFAGQTFETAIATHQVGCDRE